MKQQNNPLRFTKAQWNFIKPLLPHEQRGRPCQISRQRVLEAIWFIVVTGSQWRYLPRYYPCWQTVYYHFNRWSQKGYWRRVYHRLRALERGRLGRHKHASAGSLDSQSVKTGRTGGERGFDAGKRVKGRKRHILDDTEGLPLEILVTGANISDSAGAKTLLQRAGRRRGTLHRLRKIWVDGGYKAGVVQWCCDHYGLKLEVVSTPPEQKGFCVQRRRWVSERTFAWLTPCRRLTIDYETKIRNSENMLWIAYTRLLIRRVA